MKSRILAIVLAGLTLSTGSAIPARAQPSPAAAAQGAFNRISPTERARALDEVRAIVRESYVFPEKRAAIIDRLTAAQAAGRYDLDDPFAFAAALSADLTEASGDRHMYINVDPAQYAAALLPAADGDSQTAAYWRGLAMASNHGLTEMRVLPGDIRYLKIAPFHWIDDESGQAYDAAMRFLKGGEAMIIDLRGNGGGSADAVRYLTSHFLKGDVLLQTFHHGSDTPAQSRTLSNLPAGRLTGKPLYVLIDHGVASAAEEFAYHVEQFHLGELIGEATAGAGNNNELRPVSPGFIMSVSTGRPVHAVSGTNWEGVGIRPSHPTPAAQALDVAQSRALEALATSPAATAESKALYVWLRQNFEARLHPATIPASRLKALAGPYGEQTVTFKEGFLWLSRAGRPARRLTPISADGLFAIEGLDLMHVRLTPSLLELLRQEGGAPMRFPRG